MTRDDRVDNAAIGFLLDLAGLGRAGVFARLIRKGDGKKSYSPVKSEITARDIARHFYGEAPIGIYLVTGDKTSLGAYDLDDHDGSFDPVQMRLVASRLAAGLRRKGIEPFAIRSGGGNGIHLFAAFRSPQPAGAVKELLTRIAEREGLTIGSRGLAQRQVEVFPKQGEVKDGGLGNLIALPFARDSVPLDGDMAPIPLKNYRPPLLSDLLAPDLPPGLEDEKEPVHALTPSRLTGPDHSLIDRALGRITSDDYEMWIDVGFVLKRALGEQGYETWLEWSKRSAKFESEAECRGRWDGFPPTGRMGMGSLLHWAGIRPEALPVAPDWLSQFVLLAADLQALDLPARDIVVAPFLTSNSLSMIYAERGLGKTWFALSLAISIATGENFLAYEVPEARWVLYVDGEMPLVDIQARLRDLGTIPDRLMIIPSELLFRQGTPLNLHEPEHQVAILTMLEAQKAAGRWPLVLVFDNLSALSAGVDESDNSALDALLRWLLQLRHLGLTVILIHHAGKNGQQRGASRREDLLDTSIALVRPSDESPAHDGAHFVLTFPKTRGKRPKPEQLELRLVQSRDHMTWEFEEPKKATRALRLLKVIWEKKPKTQAELAAMEKLSQGRIAQLCSELRENSLLEDKGLELTPSGRQALVQVWAALRPRMIATGETLEEDLI